MGLGTVAIIIVGLLHKPPSLREWVFSGDLEGHPDLHHQNLALQATPVDPLRSMDAAVTPPSSDDIAELLFSGPEGTPLCYRNRAGDLVLMKEPWPPGTHERWGEYGSGLEWGYEGFLCDLTVEYQQKIYAASDPMEMARLQYEERMVRKFDSSRELNDLEWYLQSLDATNDPIGWNRAARALKLRRLMHEREFGTPTEPKDGSLFSMELFMRKRTPEDEEFLEQLYELGVVRVIFDPNMFSVPAEIGAPIQPR